MTSTTPIGDNGLIAEGRKRPSGDWKTTTNAGKKNMNNIATVTPRKLLSTVCKYYGIRNVKQLNAPVRLGSCWRHFILEEARQVACWLLKRHCDLSLEELQQCAVCKELQWHAMHIEVAVAQACRRLADGDFAFRLGVEHVEQMLLARFIGNR
ncbi:MAG: hypothetical protein IJH50_10380 [Kiritimatiellae bacterium]|nr:hypothetical protein [Kiritimatiellia bacterium]